MAKQASEQPPYDLYMQAPAAIAILRGKNHVFEFANPLYLELSGKSGSIIGLPARQAFPEIEGQGFFEPLDTVYKTGKAFIGTEVPADIDKNNTGVPTRSYFNFVYQPLRGTDHQVYGIMIHAVDVTDAVVARKRSAENEARYTTLFTSIDQGFCIIEMIYDESKKPVDYRFIEVNGMFESQTGLKNAAGKRAKEIIPTLEQKWIDAYDGVARTGKAIRLTDESEAFGRWFEVFANRVGGKTSNRVAVLFTDISQRKTAELEIQQSETRHRAMIEVLEEGVSMLDANGRILTANKSAERLLGLTLQQMQGRNSLDPGWRTVYEDGSPMPGDQHAPQHVLRTKKPYNNQLMGIYKPNGQITWLTVSAQPVLAGDEIVGIVTSFFDVTATKKVKDELERQLLVTEAITNIATSCLFMIDTEGRLTYMNPAATRVTGFTSKEALGKKLHALIHHSHPDGSPYLANTCPMVATYKNGKPNKLHEDVFFRKDGSAFPVLISATPIPSPDGVRSTVIEFRDIEEVKTALRRNTELEASTLKLQEQQAQLVAVNNAKDDFIAIASHQLRTPATAVKQYLGIVLEGYAEPLTVLQTTYIQTAYDSNERQMNIISDLLKTASLDSNRYTLKKQTVSLTNMLRNVINDMQPVLDIKSQVIDYSFPKLAVRAALDPIEMKIVFMNLLENASKYSYPETSIKIVIKKTTQAITITITDSGVGISSVNSDRIFDKFTRINNEMSDTVSGSGLGLYWVQKIIKAHSGTIKVSSVIGKGSRFTVRLPL